MSKQTIKMEDKLGLIQKNASLANVEKRNALMSDSDKLYHNFVQDTVDKIQRMRSLTKPQPSITKQLATSRSPVT